MSKQKFRLESVLPTAEQIVDQLTPHCERIEICGSIRRRKAAVSDIEILYVPKMKTVQVDLLMTEEVDQCAEEIHLMLFRRELDKRLGKNGTVSWGPKNKLAIHSASGIPLDLFATTAKNWYMALVIRTGPRDFNLRLIETANRNHLDVHAYGVFTNRQDGCEIIPNSEADVFQIAGMKYLEPRERL